MCICNCVGKSQVLQTCKVCAFISLFCELSVPSKVHVPVLTVCKAGAKTTSLQKQQVNRKSNCCKQENICLDRVLLF